MSLNSSIQALPQLPIGVQDFSKLRDKNYLYIDKTKYLYQLLTEGEVYFLSRPRRFGKSLMVSTLECIFKGQRELFKNTWIDDSDYDWKEHPVIRIDFSKTPHKNTEELKTILTNKLNDIATEYGLSLKTAVNPAMLLDDLITSLSKAHGKVIILIDEYDKPILDKLLQPEIADDIREELRKFYTIIKAQDENIRFVLLTGVTKFAKISIFSGLNNLHDISMTEDFATGCGYTQSELEAYFEPWIKKLASRFGRSIPAELKEIKTWYNGYSFCANAERVYNPFSTLILFKDQAYRPHWYATGTPNFLISAVEQQNYTPQEIEKFEADDMSFELKDIDNMDLAILLFQTGYLTIDHYDPMTRSYLLNYPNQEVKESFSKALLSAFAEQNASNHITATAEMVRAIHANDDIRMFEALKTFLARIPYQLHQPSEKYYQSIFYLIFVQLGFRMNVEVATNIGRIDAILELKDRVLIFEFKIDQSADIALQQIEDKQYAQPYQGLGKEIICFGVNFSTTERNINEWKVKKA